MYREATDQSVVVGRNEAWRPANISRLAFKLVFQPLWILHVTVVGSFYYNLCPLFGDAIIDHNLIVHMLQYNTHLPKAP